MHRFPVTLSVANNQQKILALARSNKIIFLKPVPPRKCGGIIEHYYHFVFDLILPLHLLIAKSPPHVTYALNRFGIYTNRLNEIFPGRTIIIDESESTTDLVTERLIGMNPLCVHLSKEIVESFRTAVSASLDIDRTATRNKVLLIERLPPDRYFLTSAGRLGGGTTRRSILNHKDLAEKIRSLVHAPLEFHNIQLENSTLKEQIQYFDSALVVIGQHGAGLVNCIWMRKQSIVIELSHHKSLNHFRFVSSLRSHRYYFYKISGSHSSIDTDKFADWVLSDPTLADIFS